MKTEQLIGLPGDTWNARPSLGDAAGFVLIFGSVSSLTDPGLFGRVRSWYPRAHILGCSTAGEIAGTRVLDDSVTVTAAALEHGVAKLAKAGIESGEDSLATGSRLAAKLDPAGLRHVLVFSDGLQVNGSRLTRGLASALPAETMVSGGLAADGDRFSRTVVIADGPAQSGIVTALGLYGPGLVIGWGSVGGWDIFGPKRLVTKSKDNVLYELDGKPVLDLYKKYLGRHAAELPASALLFPLNIEQPESPEVGMVRTILGVNESDGSMTFAGDIPVGSMATLMRANFDRLVEGAAASARESLRGSGHRGGLALCISCVGRRLILRQRVEEETEAVSGVLGAGALMTGFYSYGEISPFAGTGRCELHNQTMTITTLGES